MRNRERLSIAWLVSIEKRGVHPENQEECILGTSKRERRVRTEGTEGTKGDENVKGLLD